MVKMDEKIHDQYFDRLKKCFDAISTESEQALALKAFVMIFIGVGKETKVPEMRVVLVDFIKETYPHLMDDLNKLLILL